VIFPKDATPLVADCQTGDLVALEVLAGGFRARLAEAVEARAVIFLRALDELLGERLGFRQHALAHLLGGAQALKRLSFLGEGADLDDPRAPGGAGIKSDRRRGGGRGLVGRGGRRQAPRHAPVGGELDEVADVRRVDRQPDRAAAPCGTATQ